MPHFSGDSEGEALEAMWEGEDEEGTGHDGEFFGMPRRFTLQSLHRKSVQVQAIEISKERVLAAYNTAKAAKTGQQCTCPSCGKEFTKKSYQQAFCSNKGRNNCKDVFWNRANEDRAQRAQHFASRR